MPRLRENPLVEAQIAGQAKAHNMSVDEVIEKVMLKKQAVKQFVDVAGIAKLALLLASGATAQMTGASLPIDGGWSVQ
ncbi:SDR family oxidoreductase [Pontibacter sp. CAU 1760]